jgi:hypothetical protein
MAVYRPTTPGSVQIPSWKKVNFRQSVQRLHQFLKGIFVGRRGAIHRVSIFVQTPSVNECILHKPSFRGTIGRHRDENAVRRSSRTASSEPAYRPKGGVLLWRPCEEFSDEAANCASGRNRQRGYP